MSERAQCFDELYVCRYAISNQPQQIYDDDRFAFIFADEDRRVAIPDNTTDECRSILVSKRNNIHGKGGGDPCIGGKKLFDGRYDPPVEFPLLYFGKQRFDFGKVDACWHKAEDIVRTFGVVTEEFKFALKCFGRKLPSCEHHACGCGKLAAAKVCDAVHVVQPAFAEIDDLPCG